jgi:P27 family predicted phage terminase small subunit
MTTGRRGPAPEPAAVKLAKGNAGKHQSPAELRNQAAIEAGADLPLGASSPADVSDGAGGGGDLPAVAVPTLNPPDWINADGRIVWDRLAPRLATMRILQAVDVEAFARYCQNFGRWVKLQRRLDTEGETYTSESPHGTYIRSNPAFMVADRLDRALERAEANFALNPADRQRLFAARAAAGAGGGAGADLFGEQSAGGRGGDADRPAGTPAAPTRAVGFLNNGGRQPGALDG